MTKATIWFCFICMVLTTQHHSIQAKERDPSLELITGELNRYWAEVSRSVKDGDFDAYAATCHPQGVLVSGIKKTSYPLPQALNQWKQGFEDTRANRLQASVEFRFSQRLHDEATAHETGIFRYATVQDGEPTISYIHFEGLLRKTEGRWLIVMEYQKSLATEAQWNELLAKRDTN